MGQHLSQNRMNAGGLNAATVQVTPWAIIYVRPGALGQIWHQCKSLSYVAENVYQIF